MRVTRLLIPLVIAMTATLVACGDDDNVTAGSSPCLDEDTTCLTLNAIPGEMALTEIDDGSTSTFVRYLTWTHSAMLEAFRPGQKIRISVEFNPPLVVLHDHPAMYFVLLIRSGPGGSYNAYASPATTVDVDGTLPVAGAHANINGKSSNSDLYCNIGCDFDHPQTGQELSGLRIEFTVPDTYTSGSGAGKAVPATDFQITEFTVSSVLNGPQPGPAVWPKHQPLP